MALRAGPAPHWVAPYTYHVPRQSGTGSESHPYLNYDGSFQCTKSHEAAVDPAAGGTVTGGKPGRPGS